MRITEPDPALHAGFLAAWDEFAVHGEPAAERMGAFRWERRDLDSPEGFARMCEQRRRERAVPPEGFVPGCMLWAVDDDEWLGRASVRFELNDFLRRIGGHVGYAVKPSARRRGIATALLRASLDELRGLGVERALVTCDDDNVGSVRTIEKNGGVLQDVLEGKRRYWVPTA